MKKFCCAILAAFLVSAAVQAADADEHAGHQAMDHSNMDHSNMDHSAHAVTTDSEGRIGYDMKHQMDAALMKELREKVSLYADYSDAQIALSMDQMGPEYAWYVSPPEVRGGEGVLILMHGFREQGDRMFKKSVEPIGNIFPTAMGVGMAMMMSSHIQNGLDALTAKGAKEIVVVPVVSSATNELYRQWQYIFGQREEAEYATVGRVKTDAKLHFAPPPGGDPLVAEILIDHALEVSTDPANEVVVIASHGPTGAEDNAQEMAVLAKLAKIVKEDGGFSAVYGQTLQDDAPPAIREANVQKLRGLVESAKKDGKKVLVVTNLIGARTIQAKLRSDLKDLDYTFSAKGISQHANFMKWMGETIREELQ